jgi:hypothetical protein
MFIELINEIGQMIQGHPNASDLEEERETLRQSISSNLILQANLKQKGLIDPHVEATLMRLQNRLSQLQE